MTVDTLIVVAIVGTALAYTARRAWKQVQSARAKRAGHDCGCDNCGH
ncbi:MAG: FeoB-associated Cys-rich membrane protein [Gemmatimonadaceae bacterium]|nr:FeoB-associated Cys-rich membrane protein [Gemmatimonadaceae bacterium]